MDITGFWASYSDTEFFFRVTVASGWTDRRSRGVLSYYYHLLVIPLLNNESPNRDSLFFAVVIGHMNPAGLGIINVWDGLYKFWADGDEPLESYERISDLNFSPNPDGSTDISVRVPISTLTANGWGSWPTESRAIGTGAATITAWLSGFDPEFVITDVTKATGLICQSHQYTIGTNTAPTLTANHSIDYNRDTTWVDLSCEYTDADGNLPTVRTLTIEGESPITVGTPDHDYAGGSLFEHMLTYRCDFFDTLKYKWDFDDGAGPVSTGWQSIAMPIELSYHLTGANWHIGYEIGQGDTIQMEPGDVITAINTGNSPIDLGIQMDSIPEYWQLGTRAEHDTAVFYARFSDDPTPPDFSLFTTREIFTYALAWADGGHFGGGGRGLSFCVDGDYSEKVHLAFIVPERYPYYAGGEQTIKIKLWGRTQLP
ncbi:MAG TPA: hypothetical protein ENN07_01030 [candidate division Zixibacteria bacterium]|nr:hypothetical protein [candidate division Zixibacteria bacterium]